MSVSLFSKNLELLKKNNCISKLSIQKILNFNEQNSEAKNFNITKNALNTFTIEFQNSNGNFLPLTSKRNPQNQAIRTLAESINIREHTCRKQVIVIIGFIAWELITEALNKYPEALIVVVDPFVKPAKLFLENLKFDKFFKDNLKRLNFIISNNINDVSELFSNILNDLLLFELFIIPDYGAMRVNKKKLLDIGKILKSTINIKTSDILTFDHYAEEWETNQIKALPYVIKHNSLIELKNKFSGTDALVIAAGPSLSRAIPYLRKVKDNTLIISVGTALKTLKTHGITPHFTVAIDSSEKTVTQFDDIELNDTIGILSPMLQQRLLEKFKGNAFYYSTHNLAIINEWLGLTKEYIPPLLVASGTISITALDCARYLGCDNIYCFGLDLSYSSEGYTHAKDGIYNMQKALDNDQNLKIPGNYQDYVLTYPTFARYVTQTENYIAQVQRDEYYSNMNFYNVNDAGAKIANCKLLNFEEFAKHFKPKNSTFSSKYQNVKRLLKKGNSNNQNLKANAKLLKETSLKEFQNLIKNINETEKLYHKFEKNNSNKTEAKIIKLEEEFKKNKHAITMLRNTITQAHHAFGFLEGDESIDSKRKIKGFYRHLKSQILNIMNLLKQGNF